MRWLTWSLAVLALGGSAVDAGRLELEPVRQLAAAKRTEEALDLLEDALEGGPSEPESLLLKGVLLARLQRAKEAELVFLELIERRPDLPEAYNNLAALYAAAGDSEQAIAVLKAALRTHESYHTAYENLTRLYAKMASEAYAKALGGESDLGPQHRDLALVDRIGSGEPSRPLMVEPSVGAGQQAASCCGARHRYRCWW